MTARERVLRDRFVPDLTKKILKLTEGYDTSHSILALNIALTVLKIELIEPKSFEIPKE